MPIYLGPIFEEDVIRYNKYRSALLQMAHEWVYDEEHARPFPIMNSDTEIGILHYIMGIEYPNLVQKYALQFIVIAGFVGFAIGIVTMVLILF